MKLWLLRPSEKLSRDDSPWVPWYDKTFGFVVRAETEEKARIIAQSNAGMEEYAAGGPVWINEEYSTCIELLPVGEPGMIIEDHSAA